MNRRIGMRSLFRRGCMVGLFVLCCQVGVAHPWGDAGHTIVCEIAFQELEPPVKEQVKRLMRRDPEFRTFAASCVWPDRPPARRRPEHFVNFPRTTTAILTEVCPLAPKCLFTAIEEEKKVLSDRHATRKQRLEALKYLGHWVGDIHQPLHISFEDDRGGNNIRESGPCTDKLHAVWDTCLIARGLGSHASAIAKQLREEITPEERSQWVNAGTYGLGDRVLRDREEGGRGILRAEERGLSVRRRPSRVPGRRDAADGDGG